MRAKHVLVTGGAGFIGSHLCESLLTSGCEVTALDNFDPFYKSADKRLNLTNCLASQAFRLIETDIVNPSNLEHRLEGVTYDAIVHLAAKVGVRPSLEDPGGYYDVNVKGTQNLLELAARWGIRQFVFASSSSVYGVSPSLPWREDDHALKPISPYASTKLSGEFLGHVYSHLYGIRFIALRFFTVYGPRQRPDLAIHKFARLMLAGKAIPFFGDGSTRRDYTFIDDIVWGIVAAINFTGSMHETINLGNDHTISLSEMVNGLERVLGVSAIIDWREEQPGDVPQTWANLSKAKVLLRYQPRTQFEDGLSRFATWLTAMPPNVQATGLNA